VPDWKKLIAGKIAIAKKGNVAGKLGANIRIPAGQTEVKNFPVLDMGIKPEIALGNWNLRVFQALPQTSDISDFHCVTRWSQLDMDWVGVSAQHILALAAPLPNAQFVTLHGYDNYSTNLPLQALLDDDVLVAHSVLGKPLSCEHGGPARMIVPKRYAWKGAKWLKAIELHEHDRRGFWEVRGYHNEADPFLEQRFSDDE
jgi:DMSO/TMAO reductase YedYZ molybdopterin-dependent catalytic subunit